MLSIREGSVCTIRARFFNDQRITTVPITARYRLRDVTNNRTIIDWTDLVPDTFIDVAISAESNAIYRDSLTYQENALVIQADAGLSTQWVDEVRYQITNLVGYQSR
jgi:hypothetical protein